MATPQANGGVVALQGALQAATAAAEAATAALAEIKQSKATGLVSKPKELELTGKPEADRRLWQDWRFAATQYLAVKDQQFVVSIDTAITRTDPVRMGDLSPEAQGRSQALYSFLSGLVKGRLLSILRTPSLVASSNGFEAIRLIHQEIEHLPGQPRLVFWKPSWQSQSLQREHLCVIPSWQLKGCLRTMKSHQLRSWVRTSRLQPWGNSFQQSWRFTQHCWWKTVSLTTKWRKRWLSTKLLTEVSKPLNQKQSMVVLSPWMWMQSRLRVKERKVEKMVSPHAKYVARTTTVSAGPKASKAKVRPSKGKEKAMENLRAKEKGKETRVEAPHLRSVRSVARTTILPRTVSSATRDQFSKQAMLLRNLDHQVVRHQFLQRLQIQQANQIMLQQLENVRGQLQLRLRWHEPQWEFLQPTSMAKQGVYWIQVLMSTSVLQALQNGSSLELTAQDQDWEMPKARSCSMATNTERWLCVSRQQRAMNLVSQSRSWLDQFNSQSWAWDDWRMTWEPTWTSRIATLNVDDTRFRWTESWGPTIFLFGWIDLKLLTKCKRSNKWKVGDWRRCGEVQVQVKTDWTWNLSTTRTKSGA